MTLPNNTIGIITEANGKLTKWYAHPMGDTVVVEFAEPYKRKAFVGKNAAFATFIKFPLKPNP